MHIQTTVVAIARDHKEIRTHSASLFLYCFVTANMFEDDKIGNFSRAKLGATQESSCHKHGYYRANKPREHATRKDYVL